MNELVVHLNRNKKSQFQSRLNDLLKEKNLTDEMVFSFDSGESSYFIITVDSEIGEELLKDFKLFKEIDGVFLRPSTEPPI
ncbi:MAG: hypothetical protein KDC61_08475 [Saprospiraceae bacterium]|nr:hypothetical protein [Saprospiraceae bacterium]